MNLENDRKYTVEDFFYIVSEEAEIRVYRNGSLIGAYDGKNSISEKLNDLMVKNVNFNIEDNILSLYV